MNRLQFRFPFLGPVINAVAARLTGEGTIQRGIGKGLKFNARNCNPGYLVGTSGIAEQRVLSSILRPGNVFYDIGANAGYYAVLSARLVGPHGHVYAFEPTPELAERIRYNVELNVFRNVTIVESAVCDTDGSIRFGSLGFDVRNSIKRAERTGHGIEVNALRLDSWSPGHRPPDAILMDIEGSEVEALRGALATISRYRPTMIVEVHWLGADFVEFLQEAIVPLGYSAHTLDGKELPLDKSERYHALLQPRHRD